MTQLTLHTFAYKSTTGHEFRFTFNLDNIKVSICNVCKMTDGETFTWYDAALVVKQIKNIG